MTPKLVIFDCDGVLVDSEHATNTAIAKYLSTCGLQIDADDAFRLFVGNTMVAVGEIATQHGATLPENWIDAIHGAMYKELRDGVAVFPGVRALLDKLNAAGIATAIASNGPMDKMAITLAPSGLFDHFRGRIYSPDTLPGKPAPDMLLAAAIAAGVNPSYAVMIDDNPTGCLAAVAAGMPSIGFAPDGSFARLEKVGATCVRTMDGIAALLNLA